jgi:hypothetical protein
MLLFNRCIEAQTGWLRDSHSPLAPPPRSTPNGGRVQTPQRPIHLRIGSGCKLFPENQRCQMQPAMRVHGGAVLQALRMLRRLRPVPLSSLRSKPSWAPLRTMQKSDVSNEARTPAPTSAWIRPAYTKSPNRAPLRVPALSLRRVGYAP